MKKINTLALALVPCLFGLVSCGGLPTTSSKVAPMNGKTRYRMPIVRHPSANVTKSHLTASLGHGESLWLWDSTPDSDPKTKDLDVSVSVEFYVGQSADEPIPVLTGPWADQKYNIITTTEDFNALMYSDMPYWGILVTTMPNTEEGKDVAGRGMIGTARWMIEVDEGMESFGTTMAHEIGHNAGIQGHRNDVTLAGVPIMHEGGDIAAIAGATLANNEEKKILENPK